MRSKYNRYNFTREQIEEAASKAESKVEMMRILGIRQGGGGHQAIEKWCRKYGIIPPHGGSIGQKNVLQHRFSGMPDEEWFTENITRSGPHTKKRLLARGIPEICVLCGIGPEWNDLSLSLQVDHIDGDRWNNLITNLRLVCPNCHTQTDTYANRRGAAVRNYCECGAQIGKESKRCRSCR